MPTTDTTKRIEILDGIHIRVPEVAWSDRDRAAWRWPRQMKPSEWAEKYRRLEKGAIPGRWRNENAPYLRGIMDIAVRPGVEQLAVKKAVQMGVSEAMRTLIEYWAHQDPYPMGLLLPNEKKGRQIVADDIMPLFQKEFRRHPELASLLSPYRHDIKADQISLVNNFELYLMWSGSETSMASNPMKRAIGDEVNKFEPWAGNDADPVSLVRYRLTTYPGSLLMLVSTPTNANEGVSLHFDESNIKGYFLVPCVHCGKFQRMLFGERPVPGKDGFGVRWSEEVRALSAAGRFTEAAAIVRRDPASCWYECCLCHGRIDERQKRAMVRGGRWGTISDDGLTPGGAYTDLEAVREFPPGTKIGLQISSLYCCWESWTLAHAAAEFLTARTFEQRFGFRTSRLGEHWEQAAATVNVEVIDNRVKEATLPEGTLPPWTDKLIAVVDTQKDHFWMVIRAWGPGMRSQRIWHGKVFSFDEIEQWAFRHPWGNADTRLPAWICDKVYIDSGGTKKHEDEEIEGAPLPSRVQDVYAWCLKNAAAVQAIKGDNKPQPGQFTRRGKGIHVTSQEKKPVPLLLLDVHHYHDELQDLMARRDYDIDPKTGEAIEVPMWQLNQRHDPEYHQHLANMHKVAETKGGHGFEYKWRPVRDGMRVDYRAVEAYQIAAARDMGVHILPDMPTYMQTVEAAIKHRTEAQNNPPAPRFTTPDGRPFVASQR